jgi:geranylgeranyl pyrophosphate synthase
MGGAPPPLRRVYRDFGMNMGLYFQMVDDLTDIAGDPAVAKKSLRNNISEGTVTLPMIHAWQMYAGDPDLKALAECKTVPARRRAALYKRLADDEVLAKCRETMETYAVKAEEGLSLMPANIYRAGLADLLDYIRHSPWTGLGRKTGLGAASLG